MLYGIRSQVSGTKLYSELRRKPDRGASGIHEPPSGGPHIGGALATPIAALSGSTPKAPGSYDIHTSCAAIIGLTPYES